MTNYKRIHRGNNNELLEACTRQNAQIVREFELEHYHGIGNKWIVKRGLEEEDEALMRYMDVNELMDKIDSIFDHESVNGCQYLIIWLFRFLIFIGGWIIACYGVFFIVCKYSTNKIELEVGRLDADSIVGYESSVIAFTVGSALEFVGVWALFIKFYANNKILRIDDEIPSIDNCNRFLFVLGNVALSGCVVVAICSIIGIVHTKTLSVLTLITVATGGVLLIAMLHYGCFIYGWQPEKIKRQNQELSDLIEHWNDEANENWRIDSN